MLYNIKNSFFESIRSRIHLITPIAGLAIFKLGTYLNIFDIVNKTDYVNNVINLSGILAGFLFTAYGIFMSLPRNRFIKQISHNGYMEVICKTLLMGIIFLLCSMFIGLYVNKESIMTVLFIAGISEAGTSIYYFYHILRYSSKSS